MAGIVIKRLYLIEVLLSEKCRNAQLSVLPIVGMGV
jgi:hypothetical protein